MLEGVVSVGFITEVISVSNDINETRYRKDLPFVNRLYAGYQVKKLKKVIGRIREDQITTKLISEYADYYLQIFKVHNDTKKHIKQILKGNYENAGSITFEFQMDDGFVGQITVDFTDRYSIIGNYTYILIGSNSSSHITYTEHDITSVELNNEVNMDVGILNLIRKDRVEYMKNYFIKEVTKEIKEFLYSNIGVKEIHNGDSGQ